MQLNKNYAGIPYLYRKNGAVSTVMEIRMKEKIDGLLLKNAVNFTVGRFPYFKSSMVERNGDFYIAENEMPFIVTETKEKRCLGTKEVHFHMIDVTYFENQIFVAFHHALCDGKGAKRFVETLLCYYVEFKYQENMETGKNTLPQPGDILDAFANGMYPVENVKMPEVVKDGYVLPEVPDKLVDDREYMFTFLLDNDSLVRYAKENHASPAIFVALLMSKTVRSVHGDADKPIVCSMASDLREALHAEFSLKNTVNSINLPYDENIERLSFTEQADLYRKIIKEQKEENYVKKCANDMVYLFRKLEEVETLEEKKAAMAMFDNIRINSYCLSYAGRLELCQAERFVDSIQLYSSGNNGLYVNMMSVGKKTSINIIQSFSETGYVDTFRKLLMETGILFTELEKKVCDTPRDQIAATPAMEAVRNVIDKYAFVDSLDEK